jgi:hypothetical protein
MTEIMDTRQLHWTNIRPKDPDLTPIGKWLVVNRGCYADFQTWLREASYSKYSILLYSIGARLVFGLIAKAYWLIDLDADLTQVRAYAIKQFPNAATRETYLKGVTKLEAYLRLRLHRPAPTRQVN